MYRSTKFMLLLLMLLLLLCLSPQVLSLLASKAQPGAQAEATAGGLVAVVMNVLQQQAIAGVLVSEVRRGGEVCIFVAALVGGTEPCCGVEHAAAAGYRRGVGV